MQLAAHPAAERLVHELMLLQPRLATELLGDDVGTIVVAVTGQILDADLSIGQAIADHPLDLGGTHRHRWWLPFRLRRRPPCRPAASFRGSRATAQSIWGSPRRGSTRRRLCDRPT